MLLQRVLTALILAPLLLWVVLWAPPAIASPAIACVILLGAWEWAQFCGLKTPWTRVRYVLLIGACMLLLRELSLYAGGMAIILFVALLWWAVALAWVAFAPLRGRAWQAALAGLPVLAPTWLALSALHRAPLRGPQLLLFLLLLVFAADVGAYFAGRAFGRIKLAPNVSPGKTWEGVVGGLCAAVLLAVAGARWFGFDALAFVSLCTAVAAISVVGDLTESMFKRRVGLKDSGRILPGHGGMLDRIDSITAAAPIFALGMMWLGAVR